MKRFVQLAVCGLMLAASTGCCWHNWGGGGCGGGCNPYGCGYNSGQYGYGPTGYATGAAMSAGVPVYTANAPIIAPTTTAGLNPLPTY